MSARLDPARIVWDRFNGLESAEPAWADSQEYWQDFLSSFFRANGMAYDPARHSNVESWLAAPDRAPFASMADLLLPRLGTLDDLGDVGLLLLAHWLPDLHLGTSVTNFAMHRLGLVDCVGLAVSDCGTAAPLLAIDCMARFLRGGRDKALLLAMDQKHLLYKSPRVAQLQPHNAACALVLTREGEGGLHFLGYRRDGRTEMSRQARVQTMLNSLGLSLDETTVIATPALLEQIRAPRPCAADPRDLCAAPFIALSTLAAAASSVLLLVNHGSTLTGVGLAAKEHPSCALSV